MASATLTHLPRRRLRVATSNRASGQKVGDFIRAGIVARVPGWFTVQQARRVAELKGVDHVLIDDKGGRTGVAAVATLATAPATDLVARWAHRGGALIDAATSLDQARRKLRAEGSACLPVVAGGLLVGTISLQDLALADEVTSHAA